MSLSFSRLRKHSVSISEDVEVVNKAAHVGVRVLVATAAKVARKGVDDDQNGIVRDLRDGVYRRHDFGK